MMVETLPLLLCLAAFFPVPGTTESWLWAGLCLVVQVGRLGGGAACMIHNHVFFLFLFSHFLFTMTAMGVFLIVIFAGQMGQSRQV